jgi:tetratricopeptide (TPR) repeat protein
VTDGTRARLGDAIVLRLREALAERYELLDELRRGGMATVYVARDRKHDRDVALKVMDPSYAPAWARKARVLNYLAIFRDRTSPDVLRDARVAAERAATLDSLSADAQTSLGVLLFRYDWRWADAEQHLRRAIALNPAFVEAHAQLARVLRSLGRFDEARAQLADAQRIDPTSPNPGMAFGRVSYFARDYDRAIRETRGSSPRAREYVTWLADAYIARRRYADAESLLVHDSTGGPQLALVRAATGRTSAARASAAAGERSGIWHDEELAEVYTALGERDRALTLLERAVDQHDALVVDLLVRPRLDPLRNEPRFQALMRRLAFPAR